MLEKRVKSRFSHRYIQLSKAQTLSKFQEECFSGLKISPETRLGGRSSLNGRLLIKSEIICVQIWNETINVSLIGYIFAVWRKLIN